MVGVVTAVRREVERDRQALLAGGQVAPIERVGLGGRREARVLPDRPRLVHVHGRVRAAQVRRCAGHGVERMVRGGAVVPGVDRGDVDALGSRPRLTALGPALVRNGYLLALKRYVGEAADHRGTSNRSSRPVIASTTSMPGAR